MKTYKDWIYLLYVEELVEQIKSKKFKVYNKTIFTPPRRFEKKGLWYMLKLMFLSYINRNNKKYFSGHNTYWK